MPIAFDTNEHVRQLEAAHATRELAEAIVHVVVAAQTGADFATKADIAEMRTEFQVLRAELRELELRLTIKLGAMIAGAVAITAALVKLL